MVIAPNLCREGVAVGCCLDEASGNRDAQTTLGCCDDERPAGKPDSNTCRSCNGACTSVVKPPEKIKLAVAMFAACLLRSDLDLGFLQTPARACSSPQQQMPPIPFHDSDVPLLI